MELKEKVAYLSGLMDGLGFDPDSKEGKMFKGILDVFDEITEEIAIIEDDLDEMEEFLEALDEDMDDLEEILGLDEEEEDDEDEDDEDEFVSVKCPSCGKTNYFDPDVLWESEDEIEILCSNCDAVVFSSAQCGDECCTIECEEEEKE